MEKRGALSGQGGNQAIKFSRYTTGFRRTHRLETAAAFVAKALRPSFKRLCVIPGGRGFA